MSVLSNLDLDRLGPARLWKALPPDVRERAARAMLTTDDDETRTEALVALATQLRFRPQFVQKMPVAKRVAYLARQVHPDDNLAGSLLLALHLGERRNVLASFLDELEIPHDDGMIRDETELDDLSQDKLDGAVTAIAGRFPADEVDVYLASLFALDPGTWEGLRPIIERRAGA